MDKFQSSNVCGQVFSKNYRSYKMNCCLLWKPIKIDCPLARWENGMDLLFSLHQEKGY